MKRRPGINVTPRTRAGASPGGRADGERSVAGRHAALLLVVAVLLLAALPRLRLADLPLERDEGEYAYAGQLILQGIPPYQQVYNMKFPGTYYAYALSMALFGETPRGIRIGLLLVNAGTTLLLFALGRRLLGRGGGAVAAIAFVLLTLDRGVLGVFAHATHFILLPALAGLLLLPRAPGGARVWRIVAAGALLGTAALMKQHGAAFLPLGAFLLALRPEGRPEGRLAVLGDLALLAAGAAVPAACLGAVLLGQGVFDRFWFWTFEYARHYASEVSPLALVPNLRTALGRVTQTAWPLWLAAGAGLVTLWTARWPAGVRPWVTGLLVAGVAAVVPGLHFRDHYFVLLLPALALLVAVAYDAAARWMASALSVPVARGAATLLFLALAATVLSGQGEFLLSMPPQAILRSCYGACPFAESVGIGRYLREHTTPADRIAVLGSEPQIYFYARRRSATGHIYTYALTEPQPYAARMQDEMMTEIRAARPRFVVFVQETSSWNLTAGTEARILDWAWRYVSSCYRLVGVTDILAEGSRQVWGDEALSYKPVSPFAVFVYERRDPGPCDAPAGPGPPSERH